ncbi:MAG: exodeoxyribonuclease VII small subunit [Halopseudomonas sp.]|jgi:exodeoxyribonuclease VII small subunit
MYMAKKKVAVDFEQSLGDLQKLVERLESGELSLEDSLTAFEQGVALTRDCQQALSQAEQKVQLLVEQHGNLTTEPFDGPAE